MVKHLFPAEIDETDFAPHPADKEAQTSESEPRQEYPVPTTPEEVPSDSSQEHVLTDRKEVDPEEAPETTVPRRNLPRMLPLKARKFDVQQQWEGVVDEVDERTGDVFTTLHDLTNPKNDIAHATFDIEEFRGYEELLRPGAVFYWLVGFLQEETGISRISQFRPKPVAPITKWKRKVLRKQALELLTGHAEHEPEGSSPE